MLWATSGATLPELFTQLDVLAPVGSMFPVLFAPHRFKTLLVGWVARTLANNIPCHEAEKGLAFDPLQTEAPIATSRIPEVRARAHASHASDPIRHRQIRAAVALIFERIIRAPASVLADTIGTLRSYLLRAGVVRVGVAMDAQASWVGSRAKKRYSHAALKQRFT